MPSVGSVNQIEPSDLIARSWGALRDLPWKDSTTTSLFPIESVTVTRRAACSQETSRPRASRAFPHACRLGRRTVVTFPSKVHLRMAFPATSLKYREAPLRLVQTGPLVD